MIFDETFLLRPEGMTNYERTAVGVATLESTPPLVSVRRLRSTIVPPNHAGYGRVLTGTVHRPASVPCSVPDSAGARLAGSIRSVTEHGMLK